LKEVKIDNKNDGIEDQKITRVKKTTINPKNHKTIKDPGNQEVQFQEVQEVHRSQRRLSSLKNPESQESGRLA
jgi:hypothetical protein